MVATMCPDADLRSRARAGLADDAGKSPMAEPVLSRGVRAVLIDWSFERSEEDPSVIAQALGVNGRVRSSCRRRRGTGSTASRRRPPPFRPAPPPNSRLLPQAAPRIDGEPVHQLAGTLDGSAPGPPQPVQQQAAQRGEHAYSHECPVPGLRTIRVAERGVPADEEDRHRKLAEHDDGDGPQPPPRGVVDLLSVIRREHFLTRHYLDVDLLHGEGDA